MGRAQVLDRSWLCIWRRLHLSFHAFPLTSQAQACTGQKIAWGHTVRFLDWLTSQGSEPPSPGTPTPEGVRLLSFPWPTEPLTLSLTFRVNPPSVIPGKLCPYPQLPRRKATLNSRGFSGTYLPEKVGKPHKFDLCRHTIKPLKNKPHKETNKQINMHAQPGVTNHDIEEKEGLGCQQGRCCSCWLSGLRKVTEPLWASVFSSVAITLGWGLGFGGCERGGAERMPCTSQLGG